MTTDDYGPAGRSAWLDVDWHAHQRWVDVGGTPVNVIDWSPAAGAGTDQTVVFVHGLSGCWQNWLEQLPVFAAAGHRVVAMDLPGFGASPMPPEKISITGYGRLVDGLLDALEIERACLVGNSMGGFVSAEAAIRFPARVERLVLVSAAGISSQQLRSEPGLAILRRTERILTLYTAFFASKSAWVARRARLRWITLGFVIRHPERLPAPLMAEQLGGSGKPGFVDALDALTDYPIEDRLEDIACPTLIVWGRDDRLVPLRDADRFAELVSGSRKVVYDDTGHVPMLERPARFNADLEAFLDEPPAEGAGRGAGSGAGAGATP